MRIAIPYEDGVVCQHFGKAPQFKIFDVQPQGVVESVVIDSEASGHEALAEFLAAQGVQAVICGGIGQVLMYFPASLATLTKSLRL